MVGKRFRMRLATTVMLLLATGDFCRAQSAQSAKDVSADNARILSLEGLPSLGDKQAQVAIVEFGDYQCPYCGRHATETLPQLIATYVKTGKVRYFFKDVPVESIHPQALKAAEAAQCAGVQGKYWQLHDRLFQNQEALTPADLTSHAIAVGLDVHKFQQCLDDGTFTAPMRAALKEAKEAGVRGTPQFFLGTLAPDGRTLKIGLTLNGAIPYTDFQRALDQMVSPQPVGGKR